MFFGSFECSFQKQIKSAGKVELLLVVDDRQVASELCAVCARTPDASSCQSPPAGTLIEPPVGCRGAVAVQQTNVSVHAYAKHAAVCEATAQKFICLYADVVKMKLQIHTCT